ncbi:MAG: hypothetical protein Phog2KO_29300 [Phototrophicaceae bacterium]
MKKSLNYLIEERKTLTHTLVESISVPSEPKKHSITELRGLGAEIWEGIDAQEYINELRSEWNDLEI